MQTRFDFHGNLPAYFRGQAQRKHPVRDREGKRIVRKQASTHLKLTDEIIDLKNGVSKQQYSNKLCRVAVWDDVNK